MSKLHIKTSPVPSGRAGTVWAIDSAKPCTRPRCYNHLFAIRDLASHRQLAWHPFHGETAQGTVPVVWRDD